MDSISFACTQHLHTLEYITVTTQTYLFENISTNVSLSGKVNCSPDIANVCYCRSVYLIRFNPFVIVKQLTGIRLILGLFHVVPSSLSK